MRMRTLCGCLLILASAGCSSTPPGHVWVPALVEPAGRVIAVLPFSGSQPKAFGPVDGVMLAELTAQEIQKAMPGQKVLGPSAMRDLLAEAPDESRWLDIGRQAGAQLLLVGEIRFLDIVSDVIVPEPGHAAPPMRSREGTIGLRLRVLDVTGFPPKPPLANVTWGLGFPVDVEDKFDSPFAAMTEAAFRRELLQFAAERVAGLFYGHAEKRQVVSRLEGKWRVEENAPGPR